MMEWKPITEEMRGGPYLVTNNPTARDSLGCMTHIWVTHFIQKSHYPDEFICFDDADRKILGLKLYAVVDPPKPETGVI